MAESPEFSSNSNGFDLQAANEVFAELEKWEAQLKSLPPLHDEATVIDCNDKRSLVIKPTQKGGPK